MIKDSILTSICPNSSKIKVGDCYYIALPTKEWWPGVVLYRSQNGEEWEIHSYPLTRMSQLDLRGVANGGGVWSPSLSYDGDKCYLVFSNVRELGAIPQIENYLVTSDDIATGTWSAPVYLNSSFTSPYLMHDDDKKWLICHDNHFRSKKSECWIKQEYSMEEKQLVGEIIETKPQLNAENEVLGKVISRDTYYDFRKLQNYDIELQTLRGPIYNAMTTCSQGLILRGQDSLCSRFDQTIVARRADCDSYTISTKLEFDADCEKHMAGLVIFFDTDNWYYACVTRNDETKKREIVEYSCEKGILNCIDSKCTDENVPIALSAQVNKNELKFSFRANGKENVEFEKLTMVEIKDSPMVGICVQDMLSKQRDAVFEYFNYYRKDN